MSTTKTIISILIGFTLSYMIGVGTHNCWDFISGLEPAECVARISLTIVLGILLSGFIRFIIYGFTAE